MLCLTNALQAQSLTQIDNLTSLPESIQHDIHQLCLPSQYRDGAQAYRECVSREIELRNSDSSILMDDYSFDEKYAIQQSCGSETSSSSSFQECVRREVKLLDAVPPPVLSGLTEDEENAIQLNCFDAQKYQGASNYRKCLNQALQDLIAIPRADLSQLNSIQRNEMKIECTNVSRQLGPGNYRLCLAESLAAILKQQRADRNVAADTTIAESPVVATDNPEPALAGTAASSAAQAESNDQPAIELNPPVEPQAQRTPADAPAPMSERAAAADDSLLVNADNRAGDSTTVSLKELQSPTVQVTTLDPATQSDATTATAPGRSLGAPGSDPGTGTSLHSRSDTEQDTRQNTPQDTELAAPAAATQDEHPLAFLKNPDADTYSHYLKLLLPVLVILVMTKFLSMVLRKRRKPAVNPEYQPEDFPDDQFEVATDDTMSRNSARDEAPDSKRFDPYAQNPGYDTIFRQGIEPDGASEFDFPDNDKSTHGDFSFLDDEQSAGRQSVPESHINTETGARTDTATDASLLDQTLYTPVYSESEFGRWIHQQPVEEHKRLCTEFMLYWVSYGDGNYTEEFKHELLRAVDLNEHDLIKKWVLEQNPSTLVDLLQRVWSIFSRTEIEQTINMMFAVLIKNEITPVQNTFFRFLADFAHIGSEGLNRLYIDAFGSRLPPLPRPDDERWWNHHHPADPVLNNTVFQEQSDRQKCLSLLGLDDKASRQQIENAYARIAARCEPARFDQLGDKERNLVQRHLAKYTHVCKYLLESE